MACHRFVLNMVETVLLALDGIKDLGPLPSPQQMDAAAGKAQDALTLPVAVVILDAKVSLPAAASRWGADALANGHELSCTVRSLAFHTAAGAPEELLLASLCRAAGGFLVDAEALQWAVLIHGLYAEGRSEEGSSVFLAPLDLSLGSFGSMGHLHLVVPQLSPFLNRLSLGLFLDLIEGNLSEGATISAESSGDSERGCEQHQAEGYQERPAFRLPAATPLGALSLSLAITVPSVALVLAEAEKELLVLGLHGISAHIFQQRGSGDLFVKGSVDALEGREASRARLLVACPADLAPNETPQLRRRGKEAEDEKKGPAVEVRVCLLGSGVKGVEVEIAGPLQATWPFLTNTELISGLATLAERAPSPGRPVSLDYATKPMNWVYLNLLLRDAQALVLVPDSGQEDMPYWDSEQALVANVGCLRFGTAMGGDGEVRSTLSLADVSVVARDNRVRAKTLVLPFTLQVRAATCYPMCSESQQLQRQTQAAQVILRHLRRWRIRRALHRQRQPATRPAVAHGHSPSDMAAQLILTLTEGRSMDQGGPLAGPSLLAGRPRGFATAGEAKVVQRLPRTSRVEIWIDSFSARLPITAIGLVSDLMEALLPAGTGQTAAGVPVRPSSVFMWSDHLVPRTMQERPDSEISAMASPNATPQVQTQPLRPVRLPLPVVPADFGPVMPDLAVQQPEEIDQSPPARPQLISFRPHRTRLVVEIPGSVTLSLCDDRDTAYGAPDTLACRVSAVQASALLEQLQHGTRPDASLRAGLLLSLHHLSSDISHWSDLLEPWPLHVEGRDVISRGFQSTRETLLSVWSEEKAALLLAPDALQTASEVKVLANRLMDALPQQWSREGPKDAPTLLEPRELREQATQCGSVTDRAPQQFSVRNLTGGWVWCWSRGEPLRPQGIAPGATAELQNPPFQDQIRLAGVLPRHSGSTSAYAPMISLQVEGNWAPLLKVPIGASGRIRVFLKAPGGYPASAAGRELPLLVDIAASGRTKVITLHSAIRFRNCISRHVTLGLRPEPTLLAAAAAGRGPTQQLELGPLAPGQECFLPLATCLGCLVFVKVDGCEESPDELVIAPDITALQTQQGQIASRLRSIPEDAATPALLHSLVRVRLQSGLEAGEGVPASSRAYDLCFDLGWVEAKEARGPFEAAIDLEPTLRLVNALPVPLLATVRALPDGSGVSVAPGSAGPEAPPSSRLLRTSPAPGLVSGSSRSLQGEDQEVLVAPGCSQDLHVSLAGHVVLWATCPALQLQARKWAVLHVPSQPDTSVGPMIRRTSSGPVA